MFIGFIINSIFIKIQMIQELKQNLTDYSGVFLYVASFPLTQINSVLSSLALLTSITITSINIYKHFKKK
mgnify:CR=1 FL=1